MKKKVDIFNDFGIIDIKGDYQESVLYLNSLPFQYNWFAEVGTTWRYHIVKGVDKRSWAESITASDTLKNGVNLINEFEYLVAYYSQFLKTGRYEFGIYNLNDQYGFVDLPVGNEFQSFDYYGGLPDLIPTQNYYAEDKINEYKQLIQSGLRPVIVILHVAQSHILFILDGHHKFLAYGQSSIKPKALIISKLNSSTLTIEQSIKMANKMNCKNDNYLNSIRTEKKNRYFDLRLDIGKDFEYINE